MLDSTLRISLNAWRLVLLVLIASVNARAQAPGWQSVLAAAGGSGRVEALATDAAGNVYLTGTFNGNLTFGSTTLTGAGFADVFVAKWNPTTNAFVWAKRAGGADNDYAGGIAVSGANVYIVGSFESTPADFGPHTLRNAQPPTVPFNFRSDAFVAKLVDSGPDASFAWAQRAGGLGFDIASAVVASGNTVYLAGRHGAPSATFGNLTVTNPSSGTQLNTDLFVAKLTDAGSSGTFEWVQAGGGLGSDYAAALAVSGSDLYLSGAFQNYAALGSTALSAPGCTSGYVAKLTDAGTSGRFVWSQALGSSQNFNSSTATALAVRGASVYLAGNFDGVGSFGSTTLASAGMSDVFVAKLTDSGTGVAVNWARRSGGASFDGASALVLNNSDVYVTGGFLSPTATFGATVLTNSDPATTVSSGGPDIFLTKLTDTGTFAWTQQAGSRFSDTGLALATHGAALYTAGYATVPATFGSLSLPGTINFSLPFIASIGTGNTLSARPVHLSPSQHAYPNPARTTATVPLPTGHTSALVTLANTLGQVVLSQPVTLTSSPSSCPISMVGLPRGLYTLQVQVGRVLTSEKLMVE